MTLVTIDISTEITTQLSSRMKDHTCETMQSEAIVLQTER